jgi:capsular polysaccharide biosynthesis protein
MPTEGEAAQSAELVDYLGVLKRQWRIVLGIVALGLSCAGLLLAVAPKSYLATASVQVNPLPGQGDTPVSGSRVTDGVNLDTEAQLLTSAVVTGRVRGLLGTHDSDRTLRDRVSVSVPPNSAVLDIAYRARTARKAAAGADAFARAYLTNRQDTAASGQAAEISSIQHQLDEVAAHLSDLARQLQALPAGSPQRELLLAQQNVLGFRVTNLDDRLVTLQAGSPFPGQLISSAKPPTAADTPKPLLYLPAGALVGLLLGLGAAVVRDRRPRRLRHGSDVERLLDADVIADLSAHDDTAAPADLAAYRPLIGELLANLGRGPWTLLVTAAAPGCSPGRVAENVALALTRAGGRVTLVPGQPRPDGPTAVEPSRAAGVSAHPAIVDEGLRRTNIPAGAPLAEELQIARGSGWLDELEADSDFVVLAAPPVLTLPDAQALAPLCDGVLLVVMLDRSRTDEVREAINRLRRAHARLLGVVLLREVTRQPPSAADEDQPATSPGPNGQHRRWSSPSGPEAQAPTSAS